MKLLILIGMLFTFYIILAFSPNGPMILDRIESCNHSTDSTSTDINTECIKGARHVIVDNKKIRLKKFDKNALNQVSDIYCYD